MEKLNVKLPAIQRALRSRCFLPKLTNDTKRNKIIERYTIFSHDSEDTQYRYYRGIRPQLYLLCAHHQTRRALFLWPVQK